MRYNLSNVLQLRQFEARCEALKSKRCIVDLTEKKTSRTLSQNALFHVWIKVFADSIGETDLERLKNDVKRHLLGRRMVHNRFNDTDEPDDYHTSDMDTARMSAFMDKFKAFAMTDFGCYLPYEGEAGYREMLNEYL